MSYKKFPNQELVREWDKLLKMSREEICAIYEEWKSIEKENEAVRKNLTEERNNKLKEIADYMKSVGIEIYKYKRDRYTKNGYQPWYAKNIVEVISKKYPYYSISFPTAHMAEKVVNGINLHCNKSPTNIVELYDTITNQYNRKIKEKENNNKLLIKSIEYATLNNINIENRSTDQIINIVNEHAKEKYLKENLPDGTEVYLKHACYECDTYIMGERRCSCGNRRIDIIIEGNIVDGFYYYPEPY